MEWRIIDNTDNKYSVSNTGIVMNSNRNYILKGDENAKGYKRVALGNYFRSTIHRLVASAFIPNPNNYPQVNHKDGDKLNNNVTNLEWCTNEMNRQHAIECDNTNHTMAPGEAHMNAKLTEAQVLEMRRLKVTHTYRQLAEIFNIAQVTALYVCTRRMWKHI